MKLIRMKFFKGCGITGALVLSLLLASSAWGGPVVLMGIDAEDGGVGGHGPISVYGAVASSVLGSATNAGTLGILAIGAKGATDTGVWWTALAAAAGEPVTFVSGAAAIAAQSFAGFEMIGVASDVVNTPSGGLTQAELNAISARQADVAAFVNAGGGLLGFSSVELAGSYGYVAGLGAFTFGTVFDSDITPTLAGSAIGITNALDVCCWHDSYTTFPAFLSSLATYPNSGNAVAAIGGVIVFIPPVGVPEPATLILLGSGLAGVGLAGWHRSRRK